ncbi:NOP14 protein, partial [Chauna torquata]|nr:NOP14 protein [Chauna torquata]
MHPVRILLTQHVPVNEYPEQMQEWYHSALKELENKTKHYTPLICEKKKPVPLKQYTPKIVKVLEFGRKQGGSKKEQERKRLIHKHKREFKGAVHSARKRKVKELLSSLATQEGEWKTMKRKKRKH